jgi:zinc protease
MICTRKLAGMRMALLTLLLFASPVLSSAQATDWHDIKVPPLPAFHPQEPKRFELPNGMVIFLQEDHELPFINGFARIRGGSRSEPAAKAGLVSMYADAWRTGGTTAQNGDQLDDFLEARAAKVETGAGSDSTTIGMTSLKQDFDDVFKVVIDLLQKPQFREDKLEIAKKGAYDEISRRNDDTGSIVGREAAKLGYGPQSPYSRVPEYATIAAITRQDLVDWHNSHVFPNNIILGLTGDFDTAAMEGKLRQAFASWQKGPAIKKPDVPITPAKPGYYLVNKPDVNQSAISMTDLGTDRRNPDYYAIQVFNEAFGGSFSSRLFSNIRSKLGLAYDVSGGVGTTWDHPGLTRIGMSTKSESTVEAIQALDAQIDELKTNPINDAEIKRAKDSILNSFIFAFDSPAKIMRERMAYEFYGYPPDFLERYRAGVEKVTKEDVARVAAKYLHRDKMPILVVGNAAEFGKPLSTLGVVTQLDIAIPPPPGEAAGASAKPSQ